MISKPTLDAKNTGGNVGEPVYKDGETVIIATKSADMSGGHNLDTTASEENLSAKFKYPRVSQDIAPVQVQYEDHS